MQVRASELPRKLTGLFGFECNETLGLSVRLMKSLLKLVGAKQGVAENCRVVK